MFKLGADRGGWQILTSPGLWLGMMLYVTSAGLWVYALSKTELGLVYIFTALTFVLVYISSFLLLGEAVTVPKLLGLGLILAGFFVLFLFG